MAAKLAAYGSAEIVTLLGIGSYFGLQQKKTYVNETHK